jgi:hypothetical protein
LKERAEISSISVIRTEKELFPSGAKWKVKLRRGVFNLFKFERYVFLFFGEGLFSQLR